VHAIEIPLNAAVHSGIEHRLNADLADHRAFPLDAYVDDRVDLIEVHDIRQGLVFAPEDRRRVCDPFNGSAEACRGAVQRDLWN